MQLRQLHYLVEAIEQGSLGKAAQRLRISQPALTKSLRLLEQELDVALLERTSTGVYATAFGHALYARAKAVEAEVGHAQAEIGQLRGKQFGSVHVGALPSIAGGVLATAIASVGAQTPAFSARVVEKMNFELLPGLRRGEFDFVVGLAEETAELGLRVRVILHDSLCIVVRAGHPLAGRQPVSVADLARCAWLFPMVGSSNRHVLEEFFRAADIAPPTARIETTSVQMIKSVAQQSDYVGVLPVHVMERELADRRLIRLDVRSALLQRRIAICHRDSHPLTPSARALIVAIEKVCAGLPN